MILSGIKNWRKHLGHPLDFKWTHFIVVDYGIGGLRYWKNGEKVKRDVVPPTVREALRPTRTRQTKEAWARDSPGVGWM